MKTIEQEIVDIAYSFLGQEEIRGNKGFKDARFQELMETVGWQFGQAWCVYFVELVWRLAYANQNSLIEARLSELFSGGAVKTYNRFKKYGSFEISQVPSKGAIIIWQNWKNGEPYWTGHAGVVVKTLSNSFLSIEGNTNNDGSREGYKSAERTRKLNFESTKGLVPLGFIKPIEP
jgi:hypothetical protein